MSQHSHLSERWFERNKTVVLRGKGVADLGVLVKNTGMQSVFGSTYKGSVNVDKTLAANPAPSTVQKLQIQRQLRIDLKWESSGKSAASVELYSNDLSD